VAAVRVIVAEDGGWLGDALAAALRDGGLEVLGVARSVQALLDLVECDPPTVITLDLTMPLGYADTTPQSGAGLQAARTIRTRWPQIGIVAVSQHAEVPWLEQVVKLGPRTGYLLKDRIADIPELISTMRAVAGGDTRVDQTLVGRLYERKRHQDRIESLTPREKDVFALIAEGYSNRAIGRRLFLTASTVEGHERAIYRKLEVSAGPDADTADSRNRRVMAVLAYLRGGAGP
jgi:DNA-binding NarL/FixJ family response regulator